jgi:hypothetical protein
MRNTVQALLWLIIVAGIILDPVSWNRTGSDGIVGAPSWQVAMSMISICLLLASAESMRRGRSAQAGLLLLTEAMVTLLAAELLVHRDGLYRFVRGIGGEESLSLYLPLIAARIVLLYAVLTRPTYDQSK